MLVSRCGAHCTCAVSKFVAMRCSLSYDLCEDVVHNILQLYIHTENIGASIAMIRLIHRYKLEVRHLQVVGRPTLANDLLLIDGMHCVDNFYAYLCNIVTKYAVEQAIRAICNITTYPIVISARYTIAIENGVGGDSNTFTDQPPWIHVCDVMYTDAADRGEEPSQPYKISVNKTWLFDVIGDPFRVISQYLCIRLNANSHLHPDREVVTASIALIRAISNKLTGRVAAEYTTLQDQYRTPAVRINKRIV